MPIKMKVCNNTDYNEALKKRGSIFYLFSEAASVWRDADVTNREKCKKKYSDQLVEILAILRYLLKFPYRQLEGLLCDYVNLMRLDLPVPDYSTLCRRMAKLTIKIRDHRTQAQRNKMGKISVILDSSGI